MTLFVEEFAVATLVRQVEATLQPLIAKNGKSIGWTWTARLTSAPCVLGDRGRAFPPSRLPRPPLRRPPFHTDRPLPSTTAPPLRPNQMPAYQEYSPPGANCLRLSVTVIRLTYLMLL